MYLLEQIIDSTALERLLAHIKKNYLKTICRRIFLPQKPGLYCFELMYISKFGRIFIYFGYQIYNFRIFWKWTTKFNNTRYRLLGYWIYLFFNLYKTLKFTFLFYANKLHVYRPWIEKQEEMKIIIKYVLRLCNMLYINIRVWTLSKNMISFHIFSTGIM